MHIDINIKKYLLPFILPAFLFIQCKKDDVKNAVPTVKDYSPLSAGSVFTYRFNIDSAISTHTYTIQAADTFFNNKVYKRFTSPDTSAEYLSKTGARYYHIVSLPALGIADFDNNYLVDSLPVNAIWTDSASFVNPLGFPPTIQVIFYYKIVEKDVSKTINGLTYSSVIHVQLTDVTALPLATNMATGDYYYALGVGLIQQNLAVADNPTIGVTSSTYSQTLLSYNIK